ncbi:hypothetical protein [Kibdelosporangium philippinense]|uniref:hypothetical protein n=1 Tax=Kibdelosporangium philippinense TaxID=211113 RepID=UPI003613B8A3
MSGQSVSTQLATRSRLVVVSEPLRSATSWLHPFVVDRSRTLARHRAARRRTKAADSDIQ